MRPTFIVRRRWPRCTTSSIDPGRSPRWGASQACRGRLSPPDSRRRSAKRQCAICSATGCGAMTLLRDEHATLARVAESRNSPVRRVQKAHRFRAWSLPARPDGKDTTAGLTAGAAATAHLQRRGAPALILLPIFVSHQFDPLRPPGWWLPWLVDVDPLANDLAFAEFHDADDHVRARAVVPDRVFVDP